MNSGNILIHLPRIPLRCIWTTLLRNPVRETARYGLYRGCRVTGIPTVEANALACLTNREVVSFERILSAADRVMNNT